MATATIGILLRQVRKAVLAGKGGSLTDGQLLDCYLSRGEEAAFQALVQRHGPMVLAVCQRILGNVHDAEDAFQATFLVLVRKAGSIIPREQVGNSLHGVAYRTALKARSAGFKRQAREALMSRREAVADRPPDDWRAVIDREVQRLPEKYRAALVLCDLEGKTRKEAAAQLGWSEGTLSTRLTRARSMLAGRLERRGVTLSVVALTAALAQSSAAAFVPASLVASTVHVQKLIGLATSAATIPPKIAALTEGVLKGMAMMKIKKLLVIGLIAMSTIGLGIGSFQIVPADEPEAPQRATTSEGRARLPRLPLGPLPTQALVSLDGHGRLVVKTAGPGHESVQVNRSSRMVEYRQTTTTMETRFVTLKSVRVFDTHGRKIDTKKLSGLLRDEILALVVYAPAEPNPDNLQLIREGTLVFQLPADAQHAEPGYGYSGPSVPVSNPVPALSAPTQGPVVPGSVPGIHQPSRPMFPAQPVPAVPGLPDAPEPVPQISVPPTSAAAPAIRSAPQAVPATEALTPALPATPGAIQPVPSAAPAAAPRVNIPGPPSPQPTIRSVPSVVPTAPALPSAAPLNAPQPVPATNANPALSAPTGQAKNKLQEVVLGRTRDDYTAVFEQLRKVVKEHFDDYNQTVDLNHMEGWIKTLPRIVPRGYRRSAEVHMRALDEGGFSVTVQVRKEIEARLPPSTGTENHKSQWTLAAWDTELEQTILRKLAARRSLEGTHKKKRQSHASEEPKSVRIGQIITIGNAKTPDSTILTMIRITPGEVTTYEELQRAAERLAKSGRFVVDAARGLRPRVTVMEGGDVVVRVDEE